MKKQMKIAAMSTLLLSSIAAPTVSFAKESVAVNVQVNGKFTDVDKKHYANEAIQWAQQRGIVSGYTDNNGKPNGKFGPNDSVTEAQFAKMLSEFYGFKDDKGKLNKFSPTPLWSDTYYDALATYGVPLNGYFDSGLRNKSVKRGVVAQAIGHLSGNANSLTDSINYMIGEGITTGQNPQYENSDLLKYFGSNNTLTRAQVVAFLFRMDSNSIKNAGVLAKDVHTNKDGLTLAALANKGMSKLDSSLKLGKLGSETPLEDNAVVTIEDTRISITYGDVKVTRSGGDVGNNLKEIDELKKKTGFTKETRPTNKNLVTNLDSKFDFATTDIFTYVFDKSNDKEEILVFTEVKSTTASKANYDYFDTSVEIRTDYFKKSEENKKKVLKMLTDIGYDLTMDELKKLVDKSIELNGEDLHKIRNYKAHKMFDFIKIMYVK